MAPSESTILENYLLLPAELPAIISLQEFTSMFPKSQQASPLIRTLYRDLQHQRNAVVDTVKANIAVEVKKGTAMRREVAKARREAEMEDVDEEMEIERALFGSSTSGPQNSRHTINSIIPELDSAVQDLEAQIQNLEREEASLLASIQQTVGGMSDLRYGRLANPQLKDEVIEGLQTVQQACADKK